MKKKNILSMVFLAIAFSFKLQTIFIMPLYFIAFIKKEIKFRELFAFPVTYFATCIPALLFGKPLWDIIEVYFNQTQDFVLLSMNAPTLLEMCNKFDPNAFISKIAILVTVVFVIAIIIFALKNKKLNINNENALLFALLFSIGIPFLLPHMHDRYFYFVNVFALLCVFVYGKKFIPILALSEISSLICYLHYFRMANDFFTPFLEIVLSKPVASVLMFIIFALVMLYTLNKKPTTKKIVVTTVASYLVSSFVAGVFYYNEFMSLFLQIYE